MPFVASVARFQPWSDSEGSQRADQRFWLLGIGSLGTKQTLHEFRITGVQVPLTSAATITAGAHAEAAVVTGVNVMV